MRLVKGEKLHPALQPMSVFTFTMKHFDHLVIIYTFYIKIINA